MKRVVLAILDGYGIAPDSKSNAITQAHPKTIEYLANHYPSTTLQASGEAVGLPYGEVGNTEVGHLNIGAGRAVLQSLPRINTSIADATFYQNKALLGAVAHIKKTNGSIHLLGLVGEHHVHASVDHLYALLYFCKQHDLKKCFIHVITDGRDSSPKAAAQFITPLEALIKRLGIGTIASIMGRYFALDRDYRWDRVEKAYTCLTEGLGNRASNWRDVIENAYDVGLSDEFIPPTSIVKSGKIIGRVQDGDAVVFFNFRIDRPRELTKAFVLDNFESHANDQTSDPYETKYKKSHLIKDAADQKPFNRSVKLKKLYFATMTEYDKYLKTAVMFAPTPVDVTLSSVLSKHKLKQLKVSESEKERFVTIYFNGLYEAPYEGEDRIIVQSRKVPTYDLEPAMSAVEISQVVTEAISKNSHTFIVVNFANADMVGHTGNIEKTKEAITVLDNCIKDIAHAALQNDWAFYITADHGNAEVMIDPKTSGVDTEHSGNLVPFIAIDKKLLDKIGKISSGTLADVAPTILKTLSIPVPDVMTGRDLLADFR